MKKNAVVAGWLAGIILLVGCAKNPATGARQLMLISEPQEIQMGLQYDSQVVATIGLYPDSGLQRYIQQLGARLAATSERPNLPWTFRVVNDPAVNAFAIPGGHIYVTRGLLAYLSSEAQLAGVVGHEIGHVTARHTAAAMTKQQIAGLGLAIGSIASPALAQYAGAASQALGVLFLKFSRDNESQADQLGLRYMSRGNYDPHEMPAIFVMLDRQSKAGTGGGQLPEWLETHPSPAHRLDAINKQIATLPASQAQTIINRDGYIRRLNGLVFGVNPREGFFSGAQFYEPELKFKMRFPGGWTTANGAQSVVAVSPSQDAAVELSMTQERSADAAARTFLSQQGIQGSQVSSGNVNGIRAASAGFAAASQNGNLRGVAMFLEHNGGVYRILGYTAEAKWPGYQGAIEGALHSFEPLSDPRILDVQAQRLQIISVPQQVTIADFARQRSAPVPPATLAIINQTEENTPLPPGDPIKWVVGGSQPQSLQSQP